MDTGKVKELDAKYLEYERQGFHFWNSYNTKPEAEQAIRNLRSWGAMIKVLKYPNGTYIVMQKEGYRRE